MAHQHFCACFAAFFEVFLGGSITLKHAQVLLSDRHTRFSLSMEMSRLTRDGTAEPVSRDQILRHARGQGSIVFPVQLTTSRIGNLTRLIHSLLYVMTILVLFALLPLLEHGASLPSTEGTSKTVSSVSIRSQPSCLAASHSSRHVGFPFIIQTYVVVCVCVGLQHRTSA